MTFDYLWYIPKSMIFKKIIQEENYGYGLYVRKMAKALKVNVETVEKHKECYFILCDLLMYKEMNESDHPPIWTYQPEFEMQKMYWEWERYLNWLENRAFDSRRLR